MKFDWIKDEETIAKHYFDSHIFDCQMIHLFCLPQGHSRKIASKFLMNLVSSYINGTPIL